MKLIPLALISLLVLTGCAQTANYSSLSADNQLQTDTSTPADANEVDQELGYEEIIERSYQEFLDKGMTERVESAGDNYILSANPQIDFKAGLYNETFDDILSVSEENLQLFTVVSAKLMLEQDDTVIEEGENSVSLSHPDFGDFTVYFENNLIVSGESNAGGWTGEFEYAPDAETLARLDQ